MNLDDFYAQADAQILAAEQSLQNRGVDIPSYSQQKQTTLDERTQRKLDRLSAKRGTYEQDSDFILGAKGAWNTVNDLWGGTDYKANIDGNKRGMSNKIFEDADTTIEQSEMNRIDLINEYESMPDDKNASHKVYQLRLQDGVDDTGEPLYTYKTGIAKTSAADRYKNEVIAGGYDILEEKGFAGAKDWENRWHGNKANMRDRTYDIGYNTRGSKIKDNAQLQGGYTEVYNTQQFGIGVGQTEANENMIRSKDVMYHSILNPKSGRLENLVDGVQYGVGRTAAGIGDSIVDASTRIIKEGRKYLFDETETEANKAMKEDLTFSKNWFNDNMDFTGFDSAAEAETYGYDTTRTVEATAKLGRAYDSGDTIEMAGALLSGVMTAGPEWFVESAGEFVAATTGYGLLPLAGKYSNDMMEERIKANDGKELTNTERASLWALGIPIAAVNKLAADEVLANTSMIKNAVATVFNSGSKSASEKIVKEVGKKAIEMAGKGLYEGAEEIVQETLQAYGAKYGTKAEEELYSSEFGKELFQAFGGGFAGGITGGAGIDAVKGSIGAIDKATDIGKEKLDARAKKKQKDIESAENVKVQDIEPAWENVLETATETANIDVEKAVSMFKTAIADETQTEDTMESSMAQLDKVDDVMKTSYAKLDGKSLDGNGLEYKKQLEDAMLKLELIKTGLTSDRTTLQNRPIDEIQKDIEVAETAEVINPELVQSLKDELAVTTAYPTAKKSNTKQGEHSGINVIGQKFFGGTYVDSSGNATPRTGILELLPVLRSATSSEGAKQAARDRLSSFMTSQTDKIDLFESMKKEFDNAGGGEVKINKSGWTYHKGTEATLLNPMKKEMELMRELAKDFIATPAIKEEAEPRGSGKLTVITDEEYTDEATTQEEGKKDEQPTSEKADREEKETDTGKKETSRSTRQSDRKSEQTEVEGKTKDESEYKKKKEGEIEYDDSVVAEDIAEMDYLDAELAKLDREMQKKSDILKELTFYGLKGIRSKSAQAVIETAKELKTIRTRREQVRDNMLKKYASESAEEIARLQKIIEKLDAKYDAVEKKGKQVVSQVKGIETDREILIEKKKAMQARKKEIALRDTIGVKILKDTDENHVKSLKDATGKESKSELSEAKLSDHFEAKETVNRLHDFAKAITSYLKSASEKITSKTAKDISDGKKILTKIFNSTRALKQNIAGYTSDIDILSGNTGVEGYQNVTRLIMESVVKKMKSESGSGKEYIKFDIKVNEDIARAIAISGFDWLVNIANEKKASNRSDVDLKKMLGVDKNDNVTREDRSKAEVIDGTLNDAYVMLGGMIYSQLGFKIKESDGEINREKFLRKFKVELGMLGMLSLERAGYVTLNNKTRKDSNLDAKVFAPGYKTPASILYPEGSKLKDLGDISSYNMTNPGIEVSKNGGRQVDALSEALGVDRQTTGPHYNDGDQLTKREDIVNHGVTGKVSDVAEDTKDAITKQEKTKWVMNDRFVNLKNKLMKSAGLDNFKRYLGYKDESEVHKVNRPGQRGKNISIDNNIKYLEQAEAENKPMWFKWYIGTNTRFNIRSNTLNIQDKKLHRFSVVRDMITITRGSNEEIMFQLALAQAIGIKIDKQTAKTSLKQLESALSEIDEILNDGDMGDASIQEAYELLLSNNNGDPEHTMLGLAEHIAYREWTEGDTNVAFKSGLTLETDAITSGYILKIMQMPIFQGIDGKVDIDKVLAELRKGGVIENIGDDTQSYEEIAEDPNTTDAYEDPANVMSDKIEASLTDNGMAWINKLDQTDWVKNMIRKSVKPNTIAIIKLLGESVTEKKDGSLIIKISRSFMKNPFMIFNYGSSINNIIKSKGRTGLENAYTTMTKLANNIDVDENEEILYGSIEAGLRFIDKKGAFVKQYGYGKGRDVAIENYIKHLKKHSTGGEYADTINEEVLHIEIENAIMEAVEATISKPMKSTFEESYGEYMTATGTINNMFTMMFKIAKPQIDEAMRKAVIEKNKGNDSKRNVPLTLNEENAVLREMSKVLPVLTLALSNGDNNQILMAKTETGEYDTELEYDMEAQTGIRMKDGKKMYGRSEQYRLIESYSSGSVLSIHSIDASAQTLVLKAFEAMGVHDANFFDAMQAKPGTKAYNEAVAKLSTEYSMTTKMMESLIDSMNSMSKEDIVALDKVYALDSVKDLINSAIGLVRKHKLNDKQVKVARGWIEEAMSKAVLIGSKSEFMSEDDRAKIRDISNKFKEKLKGRGFIDEEILNIIDYVLTNKFRAADSVASIYTSMKNLHNTSEDGRYKLFNDRAIRFEHAALEGGEYEWSATKYIKQEPQNEINGDVKKYMEENIPKDETVIQKEVDAEADALSKDGMKGYKKRSSEARKLVGKEYKQSKVKSKTKKTGGISSNPEIAEIQRRWESGEITSEDEYKESIKKAFSQKGIDSDIKKYSSADIAYLEEQHAKDETVEINDIITDNKDIQDEISEAMNKEDC